MKASNVFKGHYCYKSDIGKVRIANEDEAKVVVNSNGNVLLVVADGMGGHNKGDYASFETVRIITEAFKNQKYFLNTFFAASWIKRVVKVANSTIYKTQDKDVTYKGMGTTLSLVLIIKKKIIVVNCGDSRVYIKKSEGNLVQLTEDQTYVNFLVKSGQISKEEALVHPERHVLTNAIGLFPSISMDVNIYEYHGESLVLCTDGLYNNVSERDILNTLNLNTSVEDKCGSLISLANFNGGNDNITLCLWETLND